MLLDLLDQDGRPASVEVIVRRDTVEFRYNERLAGIADREHLRSWLASPWSTYAYDELLWIATSHGQVALAVEGQANPWVLPDHIVGSLRSRI